MTHGCARCNGHAFRVYFGPDGSSETCAACGHPRPGDMATVHARLTTARLSERAPDRWSCHSCGAKVLDAPCCATCWRDVRRWLKTIPMLAVQLDVAVAKQARFAEQQARVRGTPTPPLPLHPEAADVRDHLRAVLVGWVRLHHEEMSA